MATLQPLAQLAWRKQLPKELSEGQVRSALTAVANRMFYGQVENPAKKASPLSKNYNDGGFLTIGCVGPHPNVADWYTNNGSLYMTSRAFMALGLPETTSATSTSKSFIGNKNPITLPQKNIWIIKEDTPL